ncbi:37S ribosomal protein S24, mitochondrial [Neolecta irregularis DAH-3]|uniref:37S ribosomal protein S24, mitochondrial n=1 Tax=Neolecta irregularis (strain DAH-3) TaxID=1198029 RepID=A0A1U7LH02_NEOID|nr:37S ribosomal protein S24, mitochondrial [Neolecta irregularis DAH-3]|eukprot:OLL21927.1 37S ribosomal protein S24, mitochondrial [Neolecta irregularis DAH-3]
MPRPMLSRCIRCRRFSARPPQTPPPALSSVLDPLPDTVPLQSFDDFADAISHHSHLGRHISLDLDRYKIPKLRALMLQQLRSDIDTDDNDEEGLDSFGRDAPQDPLPENESEADADADEDSDAAPDPNYSFEKYLRLADNFAAGSNLQLEHDGMPLRGAPFDPSLDFVPTKDALNSMAHSQLSVHRLIRDYYRKAAYSLPQLSQYAKQFTLPLHPQILQFRYTTYFGESHPAASKVVLQLAIDDLVLSPKEKHKMALLAGPRFNPQNQTLKLSCQAFPTILQNKKYLTDLVNKLIAEAKEHDDLFEDLPLDTRHYKPKKKFPFPEEWKRFNDVEDISLEQSE